MPVPKSVLKLKKTKGKDGYELEFTSSVDRVNFTLRELITRANKDVGRFMIAEVRSKVKGAWRFASKGRHVPERYQYWARGKEQDLILGIENTKKGAETAWWADQAELGTAGQPKRGFLYDTVASNIDRIREIQSQYLSALSNEDQAVSLAEENENVSDGQAGADE